MNLKHLNKKYMSKTRHYSKHKPTSQQLNSQQIQNTLITQAGEHKFFSDFVLCYYHTKTDSGVESEVVATSDSCDNSISAMMSLLSYFQSVGIDVVGICKHIVDLGAIPSVVTETLSFEQLIERLASIDPDTLLATLDQGYT